MGDEGLEGRRVRPQNRGQLRLLQLSLRGVGIHGGRRSPGISVLGFLISWVFQGWRTLSLSICLSPTHTQLECEYIHKYIQVSIHLRIYVYLGIFSGKKKKKWKYTSAIVLLYDWLLYGRKVIKVVLLFLINYITLNYYINLI